MTIFHPRLFLFKYGIKLKWKQFLMLQQIPTINFTAQANRPKNNHSGVNRSEKTHDCFDKQKEESQKKNGFWAKTSMLVATLVSAGLAVKYHKSLTRVIKESFRTGIDDAFLESLDSDMLKSLKLVKNEELIGVKQTNIRKKLTSKLADFAQEHFDKQEFEKARALFKRSLKGENLPERISVIKNRIAECHIQLGEDHKAIAELKSLLRMAHPPKLEGRLANYIGTLEAKAGRYSIARTFFRKALQNLQKLSSQHELFLVSQNIANTFIQNGEYKEAISSLYSALSYSKTPQSMGLIFSKIEYCAFKVFEKENKESFIKKVLKFAEEFKLKHPEARIEVTGETRFKIIAPHGEIEIDAVPSGRPGSIVTSTRYHRIEKREKVFA